MFPISMWTERIQIKKRIWADFQGHGDTCVPDTGLEWLEVHHAVTV